MRRRGMSETAIRRALGLSERQATAAGVFDMPVAMVRPARLILPGPPRPVQPVRAQLVRERNGPLMIDVLTAVADAGEVTREAILGTGQARHLTPLRHLTMLLIRDLCEGASLPAIGHFMGRDQSTVREGCRRVGVRLQHDADFRLLRAAALDGLRRAGASRAAP